MFRLVKKRQAARATTVRAQIMCVCVRGVLSVSDAHADVRGPQTKGVL